MTDLIRLSGVALVAAAICGVSLLADDRSVGQQPAGGSAARGADLYRTYCASCHGTSARGDGPLADSMRRRPPNLTEISKRNKGVYPKDLVYRIIDGREKVAGHGGPDMPVWGDAFLRTADAAGEESVRLRVQALVNYLETLQARGQ